MATADWVADIPWVQRAVNAFSATGEMGLADVNYRPRAGQQRMVQLVADTIARSGALVVEAGTGTGKTFAYLVPALLSGERVMVSTATKALQDQLFFRDLPGLINRLGIPVRTALLKGRNNYLCTHRLKTHLESGAIGDRFLTRALAQVQRWAVTTVSGDLSEMPGLDERSAVIPLVTSNRDNCLGGQCPDFKTCHLQTARREALAADLVVVNHHLFFADQAIRESGMAELLPSVGVAIFDEAHQLNEIGVLFLGTQLSSFQLLDFNRDVLAAGLQHARGLCDWTEITGHLERCIRDVRLSLPATRQKTSTRFPWVDGVPAGADPTLWAESVGALDVSFERVRVALDSVSELAPDFERLVARCETSVARLRDLRQDVADDHVRWLEAGSQWRWVDSPLDSAAAFQRAAQMAARGASSAGVDSASISKTGTETDTDTDAETDTDGEHKGSGPKAWIFTSATLGDDAQLDWFAKPLGLDAATRAVVSSPFDFSTQAALWVPRDLPKPTDPGHALVLARRVSQWVVPLQGRTMVLTTSLRALGIIAETLRDALSGQNIEVLVQGESSKHALLSRFRSYGDAVSQRQQRSEGEVTANGAVLVASVSFWEGVDLPGDALQLVVLDKLPFPVPDDPLTQARARRITERGLSPFTEQVLPDTAIALKQGAGRLIRSERDRGVLVIGDQRLVTMGYGRRLMQALPNMQRLETEADMLAYLHGVITKTSTTG